MSDGEVKELARNQLDKVANKSAAVVDFYTEWKMPCIMMSPIIDQIAKKYSEVEFCRVNVEECNILADKYGVVSAPTVIVFKEGEEIDRITEALGFEQLEERLAELLD